MSLSVEQQDSVVYAQPELRSRCRPGRGSAHVGELRIRALRLAGRPLPSEPAAALSRVPERPISWSYPGSVPVRRSKLHEARRFFAFASGASALVGASGCASLAGIDDYSVVDDAPVLPALPDPDYLGTCEACIRTTCGGYRDACLASGPCRAMLDCKSRCSDPNCLAKCEDTTLPASQNYQDFFNCAFNRAPAFVVQTACAEECNAGRNWDCREKYRWDGINGPRKVDVTTFDVALNARNTGRVLQHLPGIDVMPCSDGILGELVGEAGCGAWVRVNAKGTAQIHLTQDQTLFAITGGLEERHRVYPRPFPRPGSFVVYTRSAYALRIAVADLYTLPLEPSLGTILFRQVDCLDVPSTLPRVDLETRGSESAVKFTSEFKAEARELPTSGTDAGYIVNVSPDKQLGIFATLPDGSPASRQTVLVAPGWITDVTLYPLALP